MLNPLNKNLHVVGGGVACLVGAGGAHFGVVINGGKSSVRFGICNIGML